MKNIGFQAVLVASALTIFSACKKEDENSPLAAGTGKVKGRLTANLDATGLAPAGVPSGTGITFIIDGMDLDNNPDPNFTYDKVITRAIVGSDGNYSATLPVRKTPIDIEVVFDDFEFDATVITTNDEGFQETVVARRVFSRPSEFISLVEGQVLILDRKYNMEGDEFLSSATIKGKVEAQFTDNVGEVNGTDLVGEGTNYNTGNGIACSGGSGTGMTINIIAVDGSGAITAFNINNAGSGYTIGNVVTVTTGSNNALIEITDVTPQLELVPAGVVLSFVTDSGNGLVFKTATDDNGNYVIKVPVEVADEIEVRFADFERSSVFFDNDAFQTGMKIYTRGNSFVGVAADNILEQNYVYNRAN